MRDFDASAPTVGACPICHTAIEGGALFCPRCGVFLKGDGASPEALNLPMVHLLSQVCALQGDLLRQFRQGQALQARQFQQALRLQAEQLESTLAHAARQAESQEQRLRLWLRWTAGFAAAVAFMVAVVQFAG